jgi:hypothetical protein
VTIPDDWHDLVLVGAVLVALVLVTAFDPIGGGPLHRIRVGLLFVGFLMAAWFVAIWLR